MRKLVFIILIGVMVFGTFISLYGFHVDSVFIGDIARVHKNLGQSDGRVNTRVYGMADERVYKKTGITKAKPSRNTKVAVLTLTATAYCETKNNTASGLRPGPGRVSVDPRVIPLGTRLYIEGYGWAIAADTGKHIKGKRIDLWKKTHKICDLYGRKQVDVYVYMR